MSKKEQKTEVETTLNIQQLAFIDFYLGAANFHATNAAKMAGYSEKTAYSIGSRLLKNVEVDAEIKRRLMDKAEIEARLNEHARGDLSDLLDDKGKFDLKTAKTSGKSRLLKELTVTVDKTANRISYKYKIHDPQAALDKLARMQGLYNDNLNIGNKPGETFKTENKLVDDLLKNYGDDASTDRD
jgi:phage terminase small subunit